MNLKKIVKKKIKEHTENGVHLPPKPDDDIVMLPPEDPKGETIKSQRQINTEKVVNQLTEKKESYIQPEPHVDLQQVIVSQNQRIEELQEAVKSIVTVISPKEGNQSNNNESSTMPMMLKIAEKVMDGDKPPTMADQMMGLMMENFKLNNEAMRKMIYGRVKINEPETQHTNLE